MSYRHHIGPIEAAVLHKNLSELIGEITSRSVVHDDGRVLCVVDIQYIESARETLAAIERERAA